MGRTNQKDSAEVEAPFDDRFVLLGRGVVPHRQQVALVPGSAVPMLSFDLPKGVSGQAREQVARRQLHDRLGLGPRHVEMRPMAQGRDWQRALITDPAQVANWRDQAGDARGILPDYLALPTSEGMWTVATTEDGVAVRFGPQDGFSANAALALAQLEERLSDPPKVILQLGHPVAGFRELADAKGVPLVKNSGKVTSVADVASPQVLGFDELTCDLQKDPQLSRTQLRRAIRAWIAPVVIAGLAAIVWLATNVTETRRLAAERDAISQATEEIVRARFVPEGPILDVRTQVSQALAAAQNRQADSEAAQTALDLLARASTVITASGGKMEQAASADGTRLDLVLRVENFAAADALQAALAADRLTVDLIEARVSDQEGGVRAELQITSGAKP